MPKGYDSNMNKLPGGGVKRSLQLSTKSEDFNIELLKCDEFWAALDLCLAEGGALRFGLSRDKGALGVGIYGLDDKQTKYVRTRDELLELLEAIYRGFKGSNEL